MKIFISWSGEPSRSVAHALRQWLPLVVQHVKPWMSDEEISSGTRWNDSIAAALDESEFGIVCITAANQHEPWLMFEAGAIAKRLQTARGESQPGRAEPRTSRVVPLCVDLPPAEVTGPLVAFQGRCLDCAGVRRLVHDINAVRDDPLSADQVDMLFDALWPRLEEQVNLAKSQAPAIETARRDSQDMLEELIERARALERICHGTLATVLQDSNRASPAAPTRETGRAPVPAFARGPVPAFALPSENDGASLPDDWREPIPLSEQ